MGERRAAATLQQEATANPQGVEGRGRSRRLGPRPLPLHLSTALATWNSSYAALPSWKSGLLPLNPGRANPALAQSAERLRTEVASVDHEAFSEALARVVRQRHVALLDGIAAYRHHPYVRDVEDPSAVWREGTTLLRDYGELLPPERQASAPVVLIVPSLINRAYILDLKSGQSLLRYMVEQGLRPLLVDWESPGEEERGFDSTAYIAGRLEAALEAACEIAGGPVPVLGYCMGGTLAVALAHRRKRDVSALALLAAPWDFHAVGGTQARLYGAIAQSLEPMMQTMGQLPVDAIQMLFSGLDPHTSVRKFLAFGRLDTTSTRAEAFVALEDWLNDGVPLAAPMARECLYGWYGANVTAAGQWRVAGRAVDPVQIKVPALCIVPQKDRIVPPESASALGGLLPNAEVMSPPLGHIGMIVGGRAKQLAWEPLLDWLKARLGTR